jgi:hypothetical protein
MDGQHLQSRLERAARFWRLTASSLSGNPYYRGPASDHFDGRRFFNPDMPRHPGLRGFVKWRMTSEWAQWPERVENEFIGRAPAEIAGDDLRVSFVGHATFLIQTQGINILTDPVWAERAAPSRRFGPSSSARPAATSSRSRSRPTRACTGLGDATLNGRELAVASYLSDHVIPCLIGRDAHQIEDIWQYLYRAPTGGAGR